MSIMNSSVVLWQITVNLKLSTEILNFADSFEFSLLLSYIEINNIVGCHGHFFSTGP